MTRSIEVSTIMLSTLRNEIQQLAMLHLAWSGVQSYLLCAVLMLNCVDVVSLHLVDFCIFVSSDC